MVGRILTTGLYALGVCLFYLGGAALVRRLGRKNPKILLYHDCAPAETAYTADLDCTTEPRTFQAHLAYLARHYRVVDVSTIVAGEAPEGAVAITFDDGYASVYDHAFPLLKAARAPATVYLISSVVGNGTLVWVNELNCLLREGGEAAFATVRKHFPYAAGASASEVVSFCRVHYRPEPMAEALVELRTLLGRPVADHAANARLYLDWDQIAEMRAADVRFGNHTHTHPNLERLSEEEQLAEISTAQRILGEHLSDADGFAHPFGHKGLRTAQLVAESGLVSAADVGGANRPVRPFSLGRTHLANESVAGLFARMEVVEPVKAKLRQLARAA